MRNSMEGQSGVGHFWIMGNVPMQNPDPIASEPDTNHNCNNEVDHFTPGGIAAVAARVVNPVFPGFGRGRQGEPVAEPVRALRIQQQGGVSGTDQSGTDITRPGAIGVEIRVSTGNAQPTPGRTAPALIALHPPGIRGVDDGLGRAGLGPNPAGIHPPRPCGRQREFHRARVARQGWKRGPGRRQGRGTGGKPRGGYRPGDRLRPLRKPGHPPAPKRFHREIRDRKSRIRRAGWVPESRWRRPAPGRGLAFLGGATFLTSLGQNGLILAIGSGKGGSFHA